MDLRSELQEWVESHSELKPEEAGVFTEELWGFLEEKVGAVQEKLLDDLQLTRARLASAERRRDWFQGELARVTSADG